MFNLAKLADLAKDSSTAGRKKLVSTLTDLFLEAPDDRREQITLLFGDIVLKVLGQLEEETRIVLAKRICREDAPRPLMVGLAKDTILVAEQVLENSPALHSEDLVEIASTASMEHLGAIAGRSEIDRKVTSVLVDRGDNKVLRRVASNEGAEFAEESLLKLVEKARTDEAIQSALADRSDLSESAAKALVPFLTDALKERIGGLGADNTLVSLLAERAASEVAARTQNLSAAREASNALIKDVSSGKIGIDHAITKFARANSAAELGMLLAKVTELHPAAVSQLLLSASDKPLVILCKASGVGPGAYKDILTMRARRLGINAVELTAGLQRYEALSAAGAKRSLETLKESGTAFGLRLTDKSAKADESGRAKAAFAPRRKNGFEMG